ncbi:MAG: hypothetical protein QY328_02130 [Anaerolineales bacterium]|nr:MAG: hypothetical protein QY328_02130 [Anaerolineales bacterium]
MSNLVYIWETQGYKKLVEDVLDAIRFEILQGRALITQGTGAYWQLLIPSVGVVQINLLDTNGTLGIYTATQHQTADLLKSQEPNLENIIGILPVKCQKEELPNVLAGELSRLLRGSTYDKSPQGKSPGANASHPQPTSVTPSSQKSGINWWLLGGALGIITICCCIALIFLFLIL